LQSFGGLDESCKYLVLIVVIRDLLDIYHVAATLLSVLHVLHYLIITETPQEVLV
jgi:hypothetical protein